MLTHRDDGKRFVVRADEKLTAFIEIESARVFRLYETLPEKLPGDAVRGLVKDMKCPAIWVAGPFWRPPPADDR